MVWYWYSDLVMTQQPPLKAASWIRPEESTSGGARARTGARGSQAGARAGVAATPQRTPLPFPRHIFHVQTVAEPTARHRWARRARRPNHPPRSRGDSRNLAALAVSLATNPACLPLHAPHVGRLH